MIQDSLPPLALPAVLCKKVSADVGGDLIPCDGSLVLLRGDHLANVA